MQCILVVHIIQSHNSNISHMFVLHYVTDSRSLLSRPRGPSLLWDVWCEAWYIAILPGGDVIATFGCESTPWVFDQKRGQQKKHPISDMCAERITGIYVGDGGANVAAVEERGYDDPGRLHIYTSVNGCWNHQMYDTCECPQYVACTSDGHFIVSSRLSKSMYKYNRLGRQIWEKKLSFRPEKISIDNKNRILVSNTGGGCVTVYNEDGVKMFSFPAATDQRKLKPRGLCVDGEDNILVGDEASKSVLLYDPRGQFLKKLVDVDDAPIHVSLFSDRYLAVGSLYRIYLYKLW